ncbi:CHAP domain-containing protein [Staphylococcus pettenkoferi]|uniref:CHAP domain-containing protein n=2 Tax=Staphylococcus pettenkoferi TaxID=170573 RepID=UPI0021B15BED|nr:CHAP domain-containing protein [Staphylococcus pettenkoferi]MCY1567933.1 CHAP domain-containing protein [Staphylococcus pettenkoferi]MCY1588718.1 CHAP domain-containing protein [Staphylococcus pettenkoferi]
MPFQNDFTNEASVHPNTPSFKAYPGDIVVFGNQYGNGMGHVAIVTKGNIDGNWQKFESLDQNWNNGDASKKEKAHKVTHKYDTRSAQMYFIRSFK